VFGVDKITDKKITVNAFVTFSDIEPNLNPSFHQAKTRIMAIESVANKCNFSVESVEKGLPTLKNVPIVTQYNTETGNFKGHEFDIDGSAMTYGIGVIPESAEQWIEEVEENGETKHYLCSDVLLWKRQKKEFEFIQNHKDLSVSMEVMITDATFDDDVYNINSFYFTAVTVLGIGVTPAFNSANITFSQMNNVEQMMFELNNFESEENTMPKASKQFEDEQSVEPQETEPQQTQVEVEQPKEQEKEPEIDYKKLLEEEQVESGRTIRELTQERDVLTQQLEELKKSQSKEMEEIMKELEDLRSYKTNIEKEKRKVAIDGVLDNFRDLQDTDEFKELIKGIDDLTPQQLEDKCYAIVGKQARAKRIKQPVPAPKVNIASSTKEKPSTKDDRYGGLLFK
jgi:flagellar biosynthesis GTPase FlhF